MAPCAAVKRPIDPLRLDVEAFARDGGSCSGEWPLSELPRLLLDSLPLGPHSPAQTVSWSAEAEWQTRPGAQPQALLRLAARTVLAATCQRCLAPVEVPLQLQTRLLFVHSEDEAQRLDEDSDDDVLALKPSLDLRELVEDELILALPLVPRHASCPPPTAEAGLQPEAAGEAHPFAVLAALRRGPTRH